MLDIIITVICTTIIITVFFIVPMTHQHEEDKEWEALKAERAARGESTSVDSIMKNVGKK